MSLVHVADKVFCKASECDKEREKDLERERDRETLGDCDSKVSGVTPSLC